MTLASKGRSAAKGRSAVTNGRKPFLIQTTRKTPEYRRLKDILDRLFKERGGLENLSIEVQSSCRVFAGLVVQQEIILGRVAAGEAVDSSDLARMAYALERARRAIEVPKRSAAKKGRVVAIIPGAGAPFAGKETAL
ncbi:hypothetical protein [Methylobacterium radiotolerans]|uniref:Uncharacterized protein n=1 Tax=Methylobacterium radiotolerans (strain ATCC 27329 / DSM 1819 / JCM 2831 / NBRC 15690 / NCIMB 10815 / 0-1) TaxID=426355 RepID=B1M1E7_METRJ|nr:hypothetical protein [Methylobacterium radiotolerans]ACB26122.1 hypothetical protein Mrad2831_4153 [Methylobacterium radiotolerans JCM 2831]GEN01075.1 hypothetical protein MRA01_56140 [Methylobacterium radiotolerans]